MTRRVRKSPAPTMGRFLALVLCAVFALGAGQARALTPEGAYGAAVAVAKAKASDQVLFLTPSGSDSNDCRAIGSACGTLDHALTLAANAGGAVIHISGGTFNLGTVGMPSNTSLQGAGMGVTVLKIPNSACRSGLINSDTTNGNNHLSLADLTIDGNKANQCGQAAAHVSDTLDGSVFGIEWHKVRQWQLTNVEAQNVDGKGIYIIGDAVTSPASYSYSLLNVYAHDNALDGVHVGAAMREGQWTNVRGFANGRDGLWLDVSQAQINGVYAYGNTRNGIWIRNTFSSSYWNMEADKNGNYGIKVTGAVNCNGGNWQAHDNGQHTAGLADVWFDQTNTYSYGITNQTQIFGIEAGPVASGSPWIEGNEPATPTEAYGLNVDPGITGDVAILNVHIPNGGLSGAISVANAGSTGNLLLTDKPGGTANFRVLRGAMKMLAGGIYPSNGAGAAGAGIWSGSGAPTGVTGAASGDVYFRTDTPGTANQRIYIYNGSTWTGIL